MKIELIVRGICCLRPGLKGVSENITVRSIVDRFLEHSRIYFFENACQPEVFAGSADLMPRNLFRRIEVVFPIEDGNLRERVISEILAVTLADNVKARFLRADGTYRRAEKPSGEKEAAEPDGIHRAGQRPPNRTSWQRPARNIPASPCCHHRKPAPPVRAGPDCKKHEPLSVAPRHRR